MGAEGRSKPHAGHLEECPLSAPVYTEGKITEWGLKMKAFLASLGGGGPKRVGEAWTLPRREEQKPEVDEQEDGEDVPQVAAHRHLDPCEAEVVREREDGRRCRIVVGETGPEDRIEPDGEGHDHQPDGEEDHPDEKKRQARLWRRRASPRFALRSLQGPCLGR